MFCQCVCVGACFLMWDNERWITLRKASFCSRCLLIRGRRWSQSADIPSLSWLPHQSSSRRYSCSRLSNTLHTWIDTKIWGYQNSAPAPSLDMKLTKLTKMCVMMFVWGVPVQTSCRRPQRHWQASGGPPSSASTAASELPLSQHSFELPLDHSDLPVAPSGRGEEEERERIRQRWRVIHGHDEQPATPPGTRNVEVQYVG